MNYAIILAGGKGTRFGNKEMYQELRAVLEILHCGDLEVWPPESTVILLLNS